ncbi:MAG: metal-sensitive transcriptional regulator [Candidatus Magasanikbacteria bacterium]
MIEPYTGKIKLNLKKVQGQINLIQKMLDEDRYCVDIAQQINAAIGILKQSNNVILENHLSTCGAHKMNSKKPAERSEFVKELIQTFNVATK